MGFSSCKNIKELEEIYEAESRSIDNQLEELNELKYQIKRDGQEEFDKHQYLKYKYNFSDESTKKVDYLIEKYMTEKNHDIMQVENHLEQEKVELRKVYLKKMELFEQNNREKGE